MTARSGLTAPTAAGSTDTATASRPRLGCWNARTAATSVPAWQRPGEDAEWRQYLGSRDPDLRAILLNRYLGLVYRCAAAMASRIGNAVEFEELLSAGALGLVQAFDRFDPSRGNAFSTFAVPRIRGAILDELRWRDWRPRSARANGRRLSATIAAWRQRTGTNPNVQELAQAMGTDLSTFYRLREAAEVRIVVPLSELDDDDFAQRGVAAEVAAERAEPEPLTVLARTETRVALRCAVRPLPLRQRAILALYYDAEMNLREIGEILGVSESRVSQLRTLAVQSLRSRMVTKPEAG